ncbi:ty1-copia retrotransposon protein [Cucumis melo var. makuwa]|uniref:Ty1-copia retrotransposon protein n=1 Tax=Cucumis melo var. makuwa TaxID=1194695 RepID=A0A5D3DC99_CUCMM|nr:ty1-copia retrotransposon protein [Cucumis melo var. makuwa]
MWETSQLDPTSQPNYQDSNPTLPRFQPYFPTPKFPHFPTPKFPQFLVILVTILTPTSDLESSISPLSIDQLKQVSIVEPKKYTKDNKTVHLLLLNHMSYPMFDLFVAQKSAKVAGSTLESRDKSKQVKRQNGKNSKKKGQFKAAGRKIEKKRPIRYGHSNEEQETEDDKEENEEKQTDEEIDY